MKSDHIIGKKKVWTFHIPSPNAQIPEDDLAILAQILTTIFHKNSKTIHSIKISFTTSISHLGHRVIQISNKKNIHF